MDSGRGRLHGPLLFPPISLLFFWKGNENSCWVPKHVAYANSNCSQLTCGPPLCFSVPLSLPCYSCSTSFSLSLSVFARTPICVYSTTPPLRNRCPPPFPFFAHHVIVQLLFHTIQNSLRLECVYTRIFHFISGFLSLYSSVGSPPPSRPIAPPARMPPFYSPPVFNSHLCMLADTYLALPNGAHILAKQTLKKAPAICKQ